MSHQPRFLQLLPVLSLAVSGAAAQNAGVHADTVAVYFQEDPTLAPSTVLVGAASDRFTWQSDAPAFPGDRPGSLTAVYDSNLPAGLLGFPLPRAFDQDDTFTAAALFVIEPRDFYADPDGFFQISWGLWSSTATGLERTGSFADFAGDTFELLEFDYFPNRSPSFGGPFLSPTVFGEANPQDPSFDFLGSFVNVTFGSAMSELPLGQPLVALMEHRPVDDVMVFSVFRVVHGSGLVPVDGAVASVPLALLPSRTYEVDVIGLTLWHDGFALETRSLFARLTYHGLIALPGLLDRQQRILHVPPRRP